MSLIDSHAHLTSPELREQIEGVLRRAAEAGVGKVVTIGMDLADARGAVFLAERYPQQVYAAAAFHPHQAGKVSDDDLAAMAELWTHRQVVGLGEMGLDYHYDFADRATQRLILARQLELAAPHRKPIVIHCREALDDTVDVLTAHGFRDRAVVFHCFGGTAGEAARIAEHGWRISFTGVVTFKKADGLREIARDYPVEKLMLETDCPYMSPEPVRSKRPNEPAFLVHTARRVAEVRGVPFEELAEQTGCNTRAFFGI